MKTESSNPFHDIHSLASLRDEIRLQSHLFEADLKDQWRRTEEKWEKIQQELHELGDSIDSSKVELSAAASLTAETLRNSYEDLRAAIRSF